MPPLDRFLPKAVAIAPIVRALALETSLGTCSLALLPVNLLPSGICCFSWRANGLYIPKSFATADRTSCHDIIRNNPLGIIFVSDSSGFAADHIPLILQPSLDQVAPDKLYGHVARANPLAHRGTQPISTLTVFQGLDHYISPNGYATKKESGKVVPTWNYEAVHVHGRLTIIDDPAWLLGFLERLTNTHEATQSHPWKVQDAPSEYLEALLNAIVGFEIVVERYEGKLKLSQNQPEQNRDSLVDYLKQLGSQEAQAMAQKITAQHRS